MLDFFKNLFVSKPSDGSEAQRPVAAKGSSQPPAAPAQKPAARLAPPPGANGDSAYLSLQSILNGLPVELKARARQTEVGDATVSVPLDKIFSQLASGVVKIPFGEIRRAAGQVFSANKDCDTVQVVLPLDEILSQIDPSTLVRRENQKQIEVPEEISSPFGELGQGLIFSVGPGKTPASLPSRVVTPIAPVQSRVSPPAKVQPIQTKAQPIQPKAPPIQPKAVPVQPKSPPVQPAQPANPFQPFQQKPQPVPPAQPIQPKIQPVQPRVQPVQPAPVQPQPIQRQPVPPPAAVPHSPSPAVARAPISTPTPPAPSKTPSGPPAIPAPPELRSLGASLSTTTISRRTPATPQPPATPRPAQPTPQMFTQKPATPPPATPQPFPARGEQEKPVFQPPVVFQPVAQPVPQPAAQASKSESVMLTVPLANLCENWSEALRQEIAQMRLTDAKVALPAQTTEDAMKRGKLAFPWKVVRSWIKPAPSGASAHDNTVVELPLKVVAPLFLARQKDAGKAQQKVAIDEEIPNLFFGFPQPEAAEPEPAAPASFQATPAQFNSPAASPAPAAAKTVDTNYYVWDDTSDSARVDETETRRSNNAGNTASSSKTPGTSFVTRYATPNEVVSRAASLDGVSGALIALPDGLMVASKLSTDLNADTLAAFLPHIFGKVSQCTKELRMGELNNLNFTVGNVPWKIFRVNAIFFAAFGRIGQPLPTAQLAALAAELDHKKQ